jgi:hypothetical protein
MKRSNTKMGWNCPYEDTVKASGLSRDQYFRAKKELLDKCWIKAQRNFIIPIRGFESDVEVRKNVLEESRKNPTDEYRYELEKSNSKSEKPNSLTGSINSSTLPIETEISKPTDIALKVFDFWVVTFNKELGAKFGPASRKAVEERLTHGYTFEDLERAILGCSITPHNVGEDNHGTQYDDLELICRNETTVEQFIANWENHTTKLREVAHPSAESDLCDKCRYSGGRLLKVRNGQFESVLCSHGQNEQPSGARLRA